MTLRHERERRITGNYPHRFEHRLQYADMDSFRHVNNVAIARLLEEGRAALNIEVFGEECLLDPAPGQQLLFANINIAYLLQANYPGTVLVCSAVTAVGNTSWTLAQAAFQHGECFAVASAVMVKAREGRPSPLSGEERAKLDRYLFGSNRLPDAAPRTK
ncbi:MAG: hotdog domain-containing protein [Steroidobacteraceae bacterium]